MEANELAIETVQVEIKVIRVGGHKMTIAVFQQIKNISLWKLLDYDTWEDCKGDSSDNWRSRLARRHQDSEMQVLGYVHRRTNECSNFLLWTECGELFKTPLGPWEYLTLRDNEREFLEEIQSAYPQLFIAT